MNHFIEKNFFFLILIGMIVTFCIISFVRYGDTSQNNFVEITISHGDTLWEIAQQYNYNNIDTNAFIAQVKDMNHLNGKILKVGDQLRIPIFNKGDTYLTMDE